MTQKTIKLIIVLTSVSLMGLIGTQLFWVRNAVSLSEKHFDHRVTIALKDVVHEIEKTTQTPATDEKGKCKKTVVSVYDLIDPMLLDSLLNSHFEYQCVNTRFTYEIVPCEKTDKVFAENQKIQSDNFSVRLHKACLSCIWEEECFNLVVSFPEKRKHVLLDISIWVVFSALFLLIVLFSFWFIVSTIIRQKKVSEIKNDFINNMTHELQTPIATISMASEVILNLKSEADLQRAQKYSTIIYDENQRLKKQVDRVLQVAVMDKGEMQLSLDKVDMHKLIKDVTNNLCLEQCDKPVSLKYNLEADRHILNVDSMHVSSIVSNLVDNAYKYSTNKPMIKISTTNQNGHFLLTVEDNGIGMSADTQKHIFEKFYRMPTGNIHNVKGFGIGLYYVKSIVEQHGGEISVKSELNKGSRFFVSLPMS